MKNEILVIDDNTDIRVLICNILKEDIKFIHLLIILIKQISCFF